MSIDIIDWREQTKSIAGLRRSRTFLKSASNAWYSVADYLAQPALLLAVTPLLVRRLGLDQYGIWMLATALTGSFSALNLGFGDATVKYVATYRGRNDLHGMIRLVRAAITINTLLGALVAILMLFVAPALVRHVFKIVPGQHTLAVQAIQLAGGVLFFKSLESVFACILRAHEQYGASARLSVFIKAVTVTFSIAVAVFGYGVVAIMLVTLVTAAVGAVLQAMAALRLVPGLSILPTLDRGAWREIGGFGLYTWMQSVAGMIFTQGDRLLIGGFMGTTAVAYYTICVQVAQPVHGLAASAFNFLFPHLSARHSAGDTQGVRRVFRLATIANCGLTALLCLPLIFFGKTLLTLWMGRDFAEQTHGLLTILAIAFGLLSINVVPHLTLLALGQARFVSLLNIVGCAISLAVSALLIPSLGPTGAALGRLFFGPIVTLNYVRAAKSL